MAQAPAWVTVRTFYQMGSTMNNATVMRVLGGGSIVMVLFLAGALFLSFSGNRDKEQQLIDKKHEIDRLNAEVKQAEKKLKDQSDQHDVKFRGLEKDRDATEARLKKQHEVALALAEKNAAQGVADNVAPLTAELVPVWVGLALLEAGRKDADTHLAEIRADFGKKLAALDGQLKEAVTERDKLQKAAKGVDKQLADLKDQLGKAETERKEAARQLALAQQGEKVARVEAQAAAKAAKDAESKRAKAAAELDAKSKLFLAREDEVKKLTAINANLQLEKKTFDKMLAAKEDKIKDLDKLNADLNEKEVKAKAEALANKQRAEDATRLADVLRERLRKYEDTAKLDDAGLLQGTWTVSQFRKGGNGAGTAQKFLFKGDVLTLETGGAGAQPSGKIKLDAKASPKTIDWLNPDGEVWGIYSLNNDVLTITFSRGKERPTDFTPKTGDWSSYELKRVK
jgi:uncharacterized protein (TIGR03067 family)